MTILMPKLQSRDLAGALDWIDRVTVAFENGELAGGETIDPVPPSAQELNSVHGAGILLSDGNLAAEHTGANGWYSGGTQDLYAGNSYYWEVEIISVSDTDPGSQFLGIGNASIILSSYLGADANGIGFQSNGNMVQSGSGVASGLTWNTAGQVLRFALKAAINRLWIEVDNGGWLPSGDPEMGTGGYDISLLSGQAIGPAYALYDATPAPDKVRFRFDASEFTNSVPVGLIAYP